MASMDTPPPPVVPPPVVPPVPPVPPSSSASSSTASTFPICTVKNMKERETLKLRELQKLVHSHPLAKELGLDLFNAKDDGFCVIAKASDVGELICGPGLRPVFNTVQRASDWIVAMASKKAQERVLLSRENEISKDGNDLVTDNDETLRAQSEVGILERTITPTTPTIAAGVINR